jgi:hypothetical protein
VELRALLAWEEMKALVAFQTLTLPIYMTSVISGRDMGYLGQILGGGPDKINRLG